MPVVTSDDAAVYELEVTLASASHHDPIVIDRSQPGADPERWLVIGDQPGDADAVDMVHAILAASAAPVRHEPPI